jgi:hypothetical protein
MYGIGTYYLKDRDIGKKFIKNNCVCLGYQDGKYTQEFTIKKDEIVFEAFRCILPGEIVFLNSFFRSRVINNSYGTLYVSAIGVFVGANIEEYTFFNEMQAFGRKVVWKKVFDKPVEIKINWDEFDSSRENILYREYSLRVIETIADLL